MGDEARVGDGERLFRSIAGDPARGQYAQASDGRFVVSSSAFLDPDFRPSVDRAELCNSDPKWTRRSEGDAVAILLASRVREIAPEEASDRDSSGKVTVHRR